MVCLMGIDMGGTMVKAALFDTAGKEIAVHGERLTVLYPGKDMNERSLQEAEEMTYRVIRSVINKSGVDPNDILGIGVTGQANGLYMLDENGKPVHDAVLSGDQRAKGYIKKWYADGTFERILPKIQQTIWAGNVPAVMAWFKDNDRQTLDRAKTIFTAKDYMRYLLTGEFCMEITEASAIACLDRDTDTFTAEIFKEYGIEEYIDKLPKRIVQSSEIAGRITKACAQKTGLIEGTPVVGGQIDSGASILSVGVADESKLGIIVGTWGINCFLSQKPIVTPDVFMTFYYGIPGYIEVIEGSSTSATNLEWFIESYMDRTKEKDVYKACNKLVEQAPYRDTVLFLPFLYGTNVNIDAKSAFIGLKGNHGPAQMLRAIYEGVVFCHLYHIEKLLQFIQMPEVVRMAGGATRSATWMQLFADILGVRIEVSDASELGALGVALHAGVGAGVYKDIVEAAAVCANNIRATYQPDEERHAYYAKKYAAYRAVIEALDPVWERIDDMAK